METIEPSEAQKEEPPRISQEEADTGREQEELLDAMMQSLPKVKDFLFDSLYFYNNFWCPSVPLKIILSSHRPFQARDTDILLASKPKCGTTWLKSLVFTIVNRNKHPLTTANDRLCHPLQVSISHSLVPPLEYSLLNPEMLPPKRRDTVANYLSRPGTRLYATHLPYESLPDSITNTRSGCKIVYICRNLLDAIVSYWHFYRVDGESEEESSLKLEKTVDSFCSGTDAFGPHWVSVMGYWEQSLKRPEKFLFMRYEELKRDQVSEIKRLADFVGVPFTSEEEENGTVRAIAEFCSVGSLKEMKVNKTGKDTSVVENHKYFRKGEIGDWVNYLSPSQVACVNKVMQEKFQGTGFEHSI